MFDSPLIAAPMAGGTTTAALALAAQGAGAFAFAAGGYKTAEQLAAHIAPLRAAGVDFGVNLFVPRTTPLSVGTAERLAAYRSELLATASRFGAEVPLTAPPQEDQRVQDYWDEKIALLLTDSVPVVSFTFGLAPAEVVAAVATGVDALMVQHANAGGHTAAFLPAGSTGGGQSAMNATLAELLSEVRSAVSVPLVGAGGVSGPTEAKAALAAGATAVAIGTALIRTEESGARPLHKDALADPSYTQTAMTRAFTGKPARALVNDFVRDHTATAPDAYPEVHFLTTPLRAAAAAAQDPQALNLWAGTGWKSAQAIPAATVVRQFLHEL